MARVTLVDTGATNDPVIGEIFQWVTEMEGDVPNHFKVEMNFPEFFKAKLAATQVLWKMGEISIEEIQHVVHVYVRTGALARRQRLGRLIYSHACVDSIASVSLPILRMWPVWNGR